MRKLITSLAVLLVVGTGMSVTSGCKKEEKKGPMERLGEKMDRDAEKIKEKAKEADEKAKKKIRGEE